VEAERKCNTISSKPAVGYDPEAFPFVSPPVLKIYLNVILPSTPRSKRAFSKRLLVEMLHTLIKYLCGREI
jgi:hypothetical protein